MEISLIRHGRSQWVEKDKLPAAEFKSWIEGYDGSGVFEEVMYPKEAIEKVTKASLILTSDLKRAIHSAGLLEAGSIISDPLFRETELPFIPTIMSRMKLKPTSWAVMLRLLWFSGYCNQCESVRQAKLRAKKASHQLIEHANEHESIVLVGHGFFNRMIAKELQQLGWSGKSRAAAKHWSCTTYTLK